MDNELKITLNGKNVKLMTSQEVHDVNVNTLPDLDQAVLAVIWMSAKAKEWEERANR